MRIYFYFRRNADLKSGLSMKIWKIERRGRAVSVWWGRAVLDKKERRPKAAAKLMTKTWRFRTEALARADLRRRIKEQLAQGYERSPRRRG